MLVLVNLGEFGCVHRSLIPKVEEPADSSLISIAADKGTITVVGTQHSLCALLFELARFLLAAIFPVVQLGPEYSLLVFPAHPLLSQARQFVAQVGNVRRPIRLGRCLLRADLVERVLSRAELRSECSDRAELPMETEQISVCKPTAISTKLNLQSSASRLRHPTRVPSRGARFPCVADEAA